MEKEGRRPRKLVQNYRRSQRLLRVAAAAAADDDDDEKITTGMMIIIFIIIDFFHFSALAGKYSPILGCSNQLDWARWSYL